MKSKLFAEGVLIGILTPHKELTFDHPRAYYQFEPTPDYDRYRDILDLRGRNNATWEQIDKAAELSLRVERPDGDIVRLEFIFLDENEGLAVIRAGFVKQE